MTIILHKELSYVITGLCFSVHNELGRFCREKQYADRFEELLKNSNLNYKREIKIDTINNSYPKGNKIDFLIENKVVVEFKAKKIVTKEDYYQVQRYLSCTGLELGLIFNFRNTYLKAKRVLNSQFLNK